jgi:signal transduction histidine kinase
MANILFVDDEPLIRETLPKILTLHGHEVLSVATVAEAIRAIASRPFEILISDLNIGHPGDGFTVVSAMRRTHPECINLILTGYPAFETALEAIRQQVDEYLIKSTDIKQLLHVLDAKLRSKKPREIRGRKRLSIILRENIPHIIERTMAAMKQDSDPSALSVADSERIEGLTNALGQLADSVDAGAPPADGLPLDLIVQSKRILQQVVGNVLWGVASELRQVFWNLLTNGLDAISEGGVIRARVADCHHPRDARSGVRITIADDGSGIAAEHVPHLFEPFYTTKRNGSGLDCGLRSRLLTATAAQFKFDLALTATNWKCVLNLSSAGECEPTNLNVC